jgi:hypothetical protein
VYEQLMDNIPTNVLSIKTKLSPKKLKYLICYHVIESQDDQIYYNGMYDKIIQDRRNNGKRFDERYLSDALKKWLRQGLISVKVV